MNGQVKRGKSRVWHWENGWRPTNIYIVNNQRLYYTRVFKMDYETGVVRPMRLPLPLPSPSSAPLIRNQNKSNTVSNDLPRLKFRADVAACVPKGLSHLKHCVCRFSLFIVRLCA